MQEDEDGGDAGIGKDLDVRAWAFARGCSRGGVREACFDIVLDLFAEVVQLHF